MIFHSADFLYFLAIVLVTYWALPHRWQNLFIVAASFTFYGWIHHWYMGLLAFTCTLDWWVCRQMSQHPGRKRLLLVTSLVANFGLLIVFKYLDFFSGGNALKVVHALGFTWLTADQVKALLPVGISFYTFQSTGCVIDVYRGQMAAPRSWVHYTCFISFFPQLVAGPIERASHMLKQFQQLRRFDAVASKAAIVLILWGYLKKVVIADNAAIVVNKVFSLENPPWPVLWAGVFAFGIQIYADFSAYSDIARGVARLMGIELMRNFRTPYFSASPTEFWRRWHISLSTWFRDYVYIPLGGSRGTAARVSLNLLITFLISGLWHGASWSFILWGAFHGILVVLWRFWENGPEKLRPSRWPRWPQVLLTFALVNVGWLMFREQNLTMLGKYFSLNPLAASGLDWQAGAYLFFLVCFYALPLALEGICERYLDRRRQSWENSPTSGAGERSLVATLGDDASWRWTLVQIGIATLLLAYILLARAPMSSDFIYFQF